MFPVALLEVEAAMPGTRNLIEVMVTCPTTGEPTYTGSSIDAEMLMEVEISHQLFLCQKCQRPHQWSKEDMLVKASTLARGYKTEGSRRNDR